MKKYLIGCFALAFLLCACAPTPAAIPTVPAQAFPTPAPTQPPCNVIAAAPTPIPGADSRFPAAVAQDWVSGPADASVTIVIYNDFQCVECNDQVLTRLLEANPQEVRLVYRPFPQPDLYDKSLLAAQAAEAAGAQGHFWEMHNLLFAKQSDWVSLSQEQFTSWVTDEAAGLGLDTGQFKTDLTHSSIVSKVQKAVDTGKQLGIPVLPLVLLNGQVYTGPTDFHAFDQVVRLIALGKKQSPTCPEMTINPARQYLATLETEHGEIVIELYADKAPLAVNSFVFLARRGWYDGVTFHRVIPGFLAQAGDPSGTGLGGPGYVFRDEIVPSLKFDAPGMVGMVNSGPNANGSQFFITFAAAPHLDGRFTIFGRVIRGLDVLAQITPREPGTGDSLPEGDMIIRVTIEER